MILPAVTQLLIIQDRDRKLRQLKTELKNAPLERKALEGKLAGTSAALDAAKLKAKEIEVQRKTLENQVGSINDRITKYEQQKLATKKNDEYKNPTIYIILLQIQFYEPTKNPNLYHQITSQ